MTATQPRHDHDESFDCDESCAAYEGHSDPVHVLGQAEPVVMPSDTVRTLVSVPEGAVVASAIEVASWMDPETGKTKYGIRVAGEETYIQAYGMLEYAKMYLFTQHSAQSA